MAAIAAKRSSCVIQTLRKIQTIITALIICHSAIMIITKISHTSTTGQVGLLRKVRRRLTVGGTIVGTPGPGSMAQLAPPGERMGSVSLVLGIAAPLDRPQTASGSMTRGGED
jgi:hypothetical protein